MSPPQTEAHSCCSLLPYSNTPLQGYLLFPHPNMAAENKQQELLALPHQHFETELKHAPLEQPCHHHPLPQTLVLQEAPVKHR